MSVGLLVLRHGPTGWSAERRIQGWEDPPLSPEGRAAVVAWRLPPAWRDRAWWSSPLRRCVETARLLGLDPRIEPALIEMDWGPWSGRTLAELRREQPAETARREAMGLDFRAPGGESPREVQARLRPWLARVAAEGRPAGAVCHKGVIRALYAAATGWDMMGRAPDRLDSGRGHLFTLAPDGTPSVDRLNLPLGA